MSSKRLIAKDLIEKVINEGRGYYPNKNEVTKASGMVCTSVIVGKSEGLVWVAMFKGGDMFEYYDSWHGGAGSGLHWIPEDGHQDSYEHKCEINSFRDLKDACADIMDEIA